MKFFFMTMLLTQAAMAAPQIVPSPVNHLFIPEGFDSNDSVEMVVTGAFPNACYARNKIEVSVRDENIDIKITALAPDASLKGSRNCPDMVVPFKEVASIGNLQGGHYKVRVNHKMDAGLNGNLNIQEASSSAVDDHVYAAIEWVESKGNDQYMLHGWRYSNCLQLDQVKVLSNKKDTFSILPVMKQVSDFCPMKGLPVAYQVKLNFSELKSDEALLHVRTMDGKSVNTIVNLQGRR